MRYDRKIDSWEFFTQVIADRVEDCELADSLMIGYPRFTELLDRVFPEANEWEQSSLGALIEPWGFGSWSEYAEYVEHPERTCQRYAKKGKDYRVFNGRFVTCQASADQFKRELDWGLRVTGPRQWFMINRQVIYKIPPSVFLFASNRFISEN